MPRVPMVDRATLSPQDQSVYDEIAASRGAVQGPFGVLLYSPEFAKRAAHLGAYVRYECGLPERIRHLIAMLASREQDCQYEFTVHAGLARKEGISAEAVKAIGEGRTPTGLSALETDVVAFVSQLVRKHRVDATTFNTLVDRMGMRGITDVVGSAAYFTMVALPLDAFEVEVRKEHTPELPTRP